MAGFLIIHNRVYKGRIIYYNIEGLYGLVISVTNGDMYVWFILSNNAIVKLNGERYL